MYGIIYIEYFRNWQFFVTYSCIQFEIPVSKIYWHTNEYHHSKHILVNLQPLYRSSPGRHEVIKCIAWAYVPFVAHMPSHAFRKLFHDSELFLDIFSFAAHEIVPLYILHSIMNLHLNVALLIQPESNQHQIEVLLYEHKYTYVVAY
jgi:hypothetical protein